METAHGGGGLTWFSAAGTVGGLGSASGAVEVEVRLFRFGSASLLLGHAVQRLRRGSAGIDAPHLGFLQVRRKPRPSVLRSRTARKKKRKVPVVKDALLYFKKKPEMMKMISQYFSV